MKMVYFSHMIKHTGYQITEQDIQSTIRFLKTEGKPSSREDAIAYLEEKHAVAHMAAHKIVEDEQSGKIQKVEKTNSSSK